MVQPGQVDPRHFSRFSNSELALRLCSAVVLAALAIATAYVGGWTFAVLWGAAAIGIFWEWNALIAGSNSRYTLGTGVASLVLADLLLQEWYFAAALVILATGTIALAAIASSRRLWLAPGILYAGILLIAPSVLRSDPDLGFLALLLLFAIVWSTDSIAFLVGRALGGPKLVPQISPNKTWTGAVAGLAAAMFAGIVVGRFAELDAFAMAMVAALLCIAAQAGDLFESFLKRTFGAKDSGRLIPGHGGLMDRLDGFIVAALLAAIVGVSRGGLSGPAHGLLVW